MNPNVLAPDLDYILEETRPLWENLRDEQIFITGGTGFFGCWLLESFVWANVSLGLNARATVLTRDPERFAQKCPHLINHPSLTFMKGDIKDFAFPKGQFAYVIHAATEASAHLNDTNPLLMLDTIVEGTRRALEFARFCGAKSFLLTSSGAIYGKQPSAIAHVPETYTGTPRWDDPKAAYANGKSMAEHLCCLYAKQYGLDVKIARCFAFVGPYLPLDIHFAIGNFIRDGIKGGPITIMGDGTPYRSYLYAADLAIWLWTILFKGKTLQPYNVGSDQDCTVAELAEVVSRAFEPKVVVNIMKKPDPNVMPERYVPDVTLARNELNLKPKINLFQAIQATIDWNLSKEECV